MSNENQQSIQQLDLKYDNERKALFLWLANITPNSEINAKLKDCTTDELMYIFDIGYRFAYSQIIQKLNKWKSTIVNYEEIIEGIDKKILASFSLGRQGHTDQEKNKVRKNLFDKLSSDSPFSS